MAVNIKVGDFFGTFKEVQELIVSYEKFACVNYYISDSRTIENCSKIAPKIAQKAKKSLVYYSILYTCIHGGRKFKSKSKGVRPNQR
jgi:zinc finger SWIM domain-containing protein 3